MRNNLNINSFNKEEIVKFKNSNKDDKNLGNLKLHYLGKAEKNILSLRTWFESSSQTVEFKCHSLLKRFRAP